MKKYIFMALLFALVFAFNGVVFAGDASDYGQLQKTEVFIANTDFSAGEVAIYDVTTGTDGTTKGTYVTTTAEADCKLVAGIVKYSTAYGNPVIVVTQGPVGALANDSSDAVTVGSNVGTTTVKGRIGGGSKVGTALEAGDGGDAETLYIWVDPERS